MVFFNRFGLKTGIKFDHCSLNRAWLSREPMSFQLQMNGREKEESKMPKQYVDFTWTMYKWIRKPNTTFRSQV